MTESIGKIYALLTDVILPHLDAIQASQAEQKMQYQGLSRNMEEFRAEIHIHLAEIRADVAFCRQELEDTMVVLRETEAADEDAAARPGQMRIVH
jgi:hypothetical protein